MERGFVLLFLSLAILFVADRDAISRENVPSTVGKQSKYEDLLPEELKQLEIKDYATKAPADKPIGNIQSVIGPAVVLHGDASEAYFAQRGDPIFRNDVLFTLKISRLRVSFSTRDVFTMGTNSRISIDEYVNNPELKQKKLTLGLRRGKSKIYVIPSLKHRTITARVRTPKAVADVRGTKFGVSVVGADDPSASDATADSSETFHCFEGIMGITSTEDGTSINIGTGESIDITGFGLGDVYNTDPAVIAQFTADTDAPAPEEDEEDSGEQEASDSEDGSEDEESSDTEEESEEQESSDSEEESAEQGASADTTEDAAEPAEATAEMATSSDTTASSDMVDTNDIVQNQSSADTEAALPVKPYAYFMAILTTEINGTKQSNSEALYRSETRQDIDSRHDSVGRNPDDGNKLVIDWSGDEPEITALELPSGNPITSDLPAPIETTELGSNAYLSWGHWTQPIAMSDDVNRFYFNNRGYYLSGDYTLDDQMNALSSSNMTGTYNGKANGTYFTAEGDSTLSGAFRAKVDFATNTITDFDVSVEGCGHTATIFDATGTFSESSPLSEFVIDGTTGRWTIDEIAADYAEASGTLYGSSAEAIGGIWGMAATDDSTDAVHQAAGMFQGTR